MDYNLYGQVAQRLSNVNKNQLDQFALGLTQFFRWLGRENGEKGTCKILDMGNCTF